MRVLLAERQVAELVDADRRRARLRLGRGELDVVQPDRLRVRTPVGFAEPENAQLSRHEGADRLRLVVGDESAERDADVLPAGAEPHVVPAPHVWTVGLGRCAVVVEIAELQVEHLASGGPLDVELEITALPVVLDAIGHPILAGEDRGPPPAGRPDDLEPQRGQPVVGLGRVDRNHRAGRDDVSARPGPVELVLEDLNVLELVRRRRRPRRRYARCGNEANDDRNQAGAHPLIPADAHRSSCSPIEPGCFEIDGARRDGRDAGGLHRDASTVVREYGGRYVRGLANVKDCFASASARRGRTRQCDRSGQGCRRPKGGRASVARQGDARSRFTALHGIGPCCSGSGDECPLASSDRSPCSCRTAGRGPQHLVQLGWTVRGAARSRTEPQRARANCS